MTFRRSLPYVIALAVTACDGTGDDAQIPDASPEDPAGDAGGDVGTPPDDDGDAPPEDVPAEATLVRAGLADALHAHVYLTGALARSTLAGDDASAIHGAWDANAAEVADYVGAMYGQEVGDAFLDAWDAQLPQYLAYTRARDAGDAGAAEAANAELDVVREELVDRIDAASPDIDDALLDEQLWFLHEDSMLLIDAMAAGSGNEFPRVRGASLKMRALALSLVVGSERRDASVLEGDATSTAAGLRADLAYHLADHQRYLATLTLAELGQGDAFAAGNWLHDVSDAFGAFVGEVWGDAAGDDFAGLWLTYQRGFAAYARGDDDGLGDADAAQAEIVALLAEQSPQLDAAALDAWFDAHEDDLIATIDAQASGDDGWIVVLGEGHPRDDQLVGLLYDAILAQFPERFGPEVLP